MRWREEAPRPLADLCDRFLNRRLLKALDVNTLSKEKQLECLAIARGLAEAKGLEPSLCCGLRHQQLHGYHPYRGGLRLWNGQQLQALEKSSALVKSLSKPASTSWLIYPKQIDQELKRKVGHFLEHL